MKYIWKLIKKIKVSYCHSWMETMNRVKDKIFVHSTYSPIPPLLPARTGRTDRTWRLILSHWRLPAKLSLCVFFVRADIKYSCSVHALFADGGNDTKVIRLSRTGGAKHWILGDQRRHLFYEYQISPNKWQIARLVAGWLPHHQQSGGWNNSLHYFATFQT